MLPQQLLKRRLLQQLKRLKKRLPLKKIQLKSLLQNNPRIRHRHKLHNPRPHRLRPLIIQTTQTAERQKKETTTKKPETTTTTQAPTPQRDYGAAATFLSLLNSYRASLGLSQLGTEGFMQEHAMKRANDIITDYSHNQHGHDGNAGCPTKYVERLGFEVRIYIAGGECIYRNPGMTPAQALAGFQASSGHNAILTADYTHAGVGVVSYNGTNHYVVVMYSPAQGIDD